MTSRDAYRRVPKGIKVVVHYCASSIASDDVSSSTPNEDLIASPLSNKGFTISSHFELLSSLSGFPEVATVVVHVPTSETPNDGLAEDLPSKSSLRLTPNSGN
jgi:hypothetical protein